MTTSPSSPAPASRYGLLGWVLFVGLAIMIIFLVKNSRRQTPSVSLGFFSSQLQRGNVDWVDIGKDYVTGEFTSPQNFNNQNVTRFHCPLPEGTTAHWEFSQWVLENASNSRVGVEPSNDAFMNILVPLIPWFLIFGFIYFFVFRQIRKSSQGTTTAPPVRVVVVGQEPAPVSSTP